jgi:hypothetical protein
LAPDRQFTNNMTKKVKPRRASMAMMRWRGSTGWATGMDDVFLVRIDRHYHAARAPRNVTRPAPQAVDFNEQSSESRPPRLRFFTQAARRHQERVRLRRASSQFITN